MIVCLMMFKAIIEILIRSKVMNEGKFNEYRQQWTSIIKGTIYRLLVLALPQISLLCIWEFTANDSAGIIIVAVFLLFITLGYYSKPPYEFSFMGKKSVRQFKTQLIYCLVTVSF